MSSSRYRSTRSATAKSTADLNKRTRQSLPTTTKALKKSEQKSKLSNKVTYADLLKKYKGGKQLYEDPDFPAESTSVFLGRNSKGYRDFEWQRPKDICANPELFSGGASRFDVQQGALGDCWLLAVVASLSLNEPIFKNVVPDDQDFERNYIGAFRFRFWRFGKWVEVIVDDRLPTYRGKLVFMHSADKNEFWSALLEKAYAKMCGTYEALNGGSQAEAMEDFTGGMCETIKLGPKERPSDLFKQLSKFSKQSSLMGCAIESTQIEGQMSNGLITGHAYSVTGIETVTSNGKQVNLLRIRNPWGNDKEWKGKWSDNSREWETISDEEKSRLVNNFDKDGEFWMTYDDFVDNFTKLEVCHLGPESIDDDLEAGKKRWEMCIEEGSWEKNVNAGGCRNFLDSFISNPQYRVEVVDPDEDDDENMGTIIVGLMQKDMRKKNKDFYVVGYVIYKLKDSNTGILNKSFFKFTTSIAKSPGFINTREVCGRHKLPPGHYVIIPSTFKPNEEAEFIMRIFSQKPNKSGQLDSANGRIGVAKHLIDAIDSKVNKKESEVTRNLRRDLQKIFQDISGPDETINSCEVREILNGFMKRGPLRQMRNFVGFDMEVCRSMVALSDDNHTGKMEFEEFMELFKNLQLWKDAFKEFDADDNGVFDAFEFRNALGNCGLSVSNDLFKVLGHRYSDPVTGKITFTDFIMAVIRLTNAFETIELQERNNKKELLFTDEEFMECFLYM